MILTRKSDGKEFDLRDAIKYKSLWNKAEKIEDLLYNSFKVNNLMFECEDEETKQEIYKAMDCLRKFRENLKLKFEVL